MDRTEQAAAIARTMMVDGQVRPNKVTDSRIIEAMRNLPRERFVPPAVSAIAYADEDVPLGGGRFLMEPMVMARLVQLAGVRDGDHALVVGSGTGYGAALLEACGARVVALEDDAALLDLARPALAAVGSGVVLVEGPLAEGWPGGAPYDVILIEGAVEEIPAAVAAQLRPVAPRFGGRLVTVRRADGVCQGGIAEVSGTGLSFQPVFDCATPLLPALRQPAAFVF
jgi:protein-L-isoaspartate(D-aspartate) O-methyltransferase